MVYEIIVPNSTTPKKDPEHPCACQFREFFLEEKRGEFIHWLFEEGDYVNTYDVVCEGEIEKKTLEFYPPHAGILVEILIPEDGEFCAGDVLGLIDDGE